MSLTVSREIKLGTCCICEGEEDVCILVALPRRCVVPGHGWGCVVCGLPSEGAIAVVCTKCEPKIEKNNLALRFACRGWPAIDGRVKIGELPVETFDHDRSLHPEYWE